MIGCKIRKFLETKKSFFRNYTCYKLCKSRMFGPVLLSYVHTYALTLQSVSPFFAFGSTVYEFSNPEGSFLKKPRRKLTPKQRLGANWDGCHRLVGLKISVGANFALQNSPQVPRQVHNFEFLQNWKKISNWNCKPHLKRKYRRMQHVVHVDGEVFVVADGEHEVPVDQVQSPEQFFFC
jgi:hypothetical protein